jgi:hypothetical protein
MRLPMWVTITVVLTLTGLLVYNMVVIGPEGLPGSYLVGGLLGAYAGIDQLLKRKAQGDDEPEPPPPAPKPGVSDRPPEPPGEV